MNVLIISRCPCPCPSGYE